MSKPTTAEIRELMERHVDNTDFCLWDKYDFDWAESTIWQLLDRLEAEKTRADIAEDNLVTEKLEHDATANRNKELEGWNQGLNAVNERLLDRAKRAEATIKQVRGLLEEHLNQPDTMKIRDVEDLNRRTRKALIGDGNEK